MEMLYYFEFMGYQTMRGPSYDDDNKYAWDSQNKIGQPKKEAVQKKNREKEPCKICQGQQRRSLLKYIRSKSQSHRHSDTDIKEEDEEEEEEETGRKLTEEEKTKC